MKVESYSLENLIQTTYTLNPMQNNRSSFIPICVGKQLSKLLSNHGWPNPMIFYTRSGRIEQFINTMLIKTSGQKFSTSTVSEKSPERSTITTQSTYYVAREIMNSWKWLTSAISFDWSRLKIGVKFKKLYFLIELAQLFADNYFLFFTA